METRRPMDVEPDAAPVPVPDGGLDAVVGAAVAGMDPGWTLLRGRMLDGGARHPPARLRYVLLHPRIGVALLEVAPDLTPEASARLRRRLDAARFGAVFPGHLPIVHRSLPAERLGLLGELLERAFAMEQPISLPGGEAWPAMVGRVLPAAAPAAPATSPQRTSVSRYGANDRRPSKASLVSVWSARRALTASSTTPTPMNSDPATPKAA